MDWELLRHALLLTLIGMGMTFAALGALVLGMFLLGGIKARGDDSRQIDEEAGEAPVTSAEDSALMADARYLAAAAAVAVARAQLARENRQPAGAPVDQWRSHVRAQHLVRRNHALRR